MSLGIVIKSPSGIVLAADSRVTLIASNTVTGNTFPVHYDNASKLLRFGAPNTFVGAVTFGQAVVPVIERTAESMVPEFEAHLQANAEGRLPVERFAQELSRFFLDQWGSAPLPGPGGDMVFFVGGYDDGAAYGRVFAFHIPSAPDPTELQVDDFGCTWGGQKSIVDRIYRGWDAELPDEIAAKLGLDASQRDLLATVMNQRQINFPIKVMALQDCVDLAVTLIGTTVSIQQLAVELRGVGGPVDVVTITRTVGLVPVMLKEVVAHGF